MVRTNTNDNKRKSYMVLLAACLSMIMTPMNQVSAHSWIECLDKDEKVVYDTAKEYIYAGKGQGAGHCAGYPKNYVGRGHGDDAVMVKNHRSVVESPQGAQVCKPGAANYYGTGFGKRLQIKAGETFLFSYLPNGHVAKDKSARGTLWGVYWTGKPGTALTNSNELTDDKLVDGQKHDFDDKRCGQTLDMEGKPSGRAGNDFPCVGRIKMPSNTAPGIYSMVWLWKFYDVNNPGHLLGKYGGDAYSSCFEVEVVPGGETGQEASQVPPKTIATREDKEEEFKPPMTIGTKSPDNLRGRRRVYNFSTKFNQTTLAALNELCKIEQDVDFYGQDLENVPAKNQFDCCRKCRRFEGCKAFTFTPWKGGTCFLKSGKPAKTSLYDGAFSGLVG